MTLYDIDNQIMNLVDPETGEISDFEAFESLQMERDAKIENVALWYKNLCAESAAIKAEEKSLADRRKFAENKAESLKKYLAFALQGNKFTTPKVAVSFRSAKSVEIENESEFISWAKQNNPDLLTFPDPKPSKTAIKEAITSSVEVPFAKISESKAINIK